MGKAKQVRKKPVRHVWGRIRNVEVGSLLFHFELTKAGLIVRRRGARIKTAETLDFVRLTNGGGFERVLNGLSVKFWLAEGGLTVKTGHVEKTLDWDTLANLGQEQPALFPQRTEAAA